MNEQIKNDILTKIHGNDVVATSYTGANVYIVRDMRNIPLVVIHNNYFVNENTISVHGKNTPITVSAKSMEHARRAMMEILTAAQAKSNEKIFPRTR